MSSRKRPREDDFDKTDNKKIILGGFNYGTAVPTVYNPNVLFLPGKTKFQDLDENMRESVFQFLNVKQIPTIKTLSKSFQESHFKIIHTYLICNSENISSYLFHLIKHEKIILEIYCSFIDFRFFFKHLVSYLKTLIQFDKQNKFEQTESFSDQFIIPSLETYSKIRNKVHHIEFRINTADVDSSKSIFFEILHPYLINDLELKLENTKDPYPFKFDFFIPSLTEQWLFSNIPKNIFCKNPYYQFTVYETPLFHDERDEYALNCDNVHVRHLKMNVVVNLPHFDKQAVLSKLNIYISRTGYLERLILVINLNEQYPTSHSLSHDWEEFIITVAAILPIKEIQIEWEVYLPNQPHFPLNVLQALNLIYEKSNKPILWKVSPLAIKFVNFLEKFPSRLTSHVQISHWVWHSLFSKYYDPVFNSYLSNAVHIEFNLPPVMQYMDNPKDDLLDTNQKVAENRAEIILGPIWKTNWNLFIDPKKISHVILRKK